MEFGVPLDMSTRSGAAILWLKEKRMLPFPTKTRVPTGPPRGDYHREEVLPHSW